jgi:hypothetical protein
MGCAGGFCGVRLGVVVDGSGMGRAWRGWRMHAVQAWEAGGAGEREASALRHELGRPADMSAHDRTSDRPPAARAREPLRQGRREADRWEGTERRADGRELSRRGEEAAWSAA